MPSTILPTRSTVPGCSEMHPSLGRCNALATATQGTRPGPGLTRSVRPGRTQRAVLPQARPPAQNRTFAQTHKRSAASPTTATRSGTSCGWKCAALSADLRGGGAELRPPRLDRAQALLQAGPSPGLDLEISHLGLSSDRLSVLEPGVRLLDEQELLGLGALHPGHGRTSRVVMAVIGGPGSDDATATLAAHGFPA